MIAQLFLKILIWKHYFLYLRVNINFESDSSLTFLFFFLNKKLSM